ITDFGFNGRHAYYYVALEKGYYKAEGLNVNILRGQGSIDAVKKVASGAADIGFADAGALVLARGNAAIPAKLLAIIYASPPHASARLEKSRAANRCWRTPSSPKRSCGSPTRLRASTTMATGSSPPRPRSRTTQTW